MPTFAASRLVSGPYDEGLIRETAMALRQELSGKPSFGLVFVTPDYADKAADLICRGLDRNQAVIAFPFFFALVTRIGGLLPDRLRRWTMRPFRFTVSDRD